MAFHDGLTDLPNRVAFVQALDQMIEACAGADEFAVVSIDLDRFKEINDVFGHVVGDRLLVEVSRALQAATQGAVIARLSGDEFGLIVDGEQPKAGRALAERLIEAMRAEFVIEDKTIHVAVTAGIAVFPRNGKDAAALLANADAALFRAKDEARGGVRVFEAEMDQQIRDRRAMHQDLSTALQERRTVAVLPAAGADRPRHRRLRGAGALDPSGARLCLARRVHSAGRGKRPDRRDGRMDPARGVPRGGVVEEAAADRGQPVAGAVPAWRPASASSIRSCWRPG